ncbi:mechanosensitive ion channel family protein [Gluconacetobacter entanii]|uniref:mechanosensitive ion channel family protein n=1 Tax=Gluconacetobacter entanii TaxID=108528 RepID=UPI0021BBC742|nr:mechanosensitive ion channel domain-containing protein [Gluconacetobacter entanii]MCW4580267.1 mechanosensitive ion channel [Gluconacetobacter entanii]MCW4583562.1 mechanosensitive ion channel [Gluconacetobacter entanii]MCW4586943.1 mechanosensitive ion channel [Gluconacetobacter entanii]
MLLSIGGVCPPARAENTPTPGMTREQAQQVLSVINDPEKRAAFENTLSAIATQLPPPAPVTPPARPAPHAATDALSVQPDSLGSDFVQDMTSLRHRLLVQAQHFVALFGDLVFVAHWTHTVLTDQQSRGIMLDAVGRATFILLIALAAEHVFSLLLRRPLKNVTARAIATEQRLGQAAATTTTQAGSDTDTQQTQQQDAQAQHATLRLLARVPYSLLHLLIKLLPVGLFLALGYAFAALLTTTHQAALVTITLTNAYVVARVVYLLMETLFVPHSPAIRLCNASDQTAFMVTRWLNFLVAAPSVVVCLSTLGGVFDMPARGTEAIIRTVVLVEHVLVAIFTWRVRMHVAVALQPSERLRKQPFWMFMGKLVYLWWIPAMFFNFALWLIWATHISGGYEWIIRTVILTTLVVILSRLFSVLAYNLQNRLFHISPALEARYPGLQARVDHYYPISRKTLTFLLYFGTAVLFLQSLGLPAIHFFMYSRLGTKVIDAILTVLVAYTIAIIVWEGVNAALQTQINHFDATAQEGRASRLRTVLPIIKTVLLAIIVIIVAVTTLSQIGINVAPLLTGAGIMGAAIAFGAQSLVKDFITGFFMLAENAIQVGDWVTASGISGTVEHLSIRTLRLRSVNGDLHIIPFSEVSSIANTSRDYNLVVTNFMIDLSEDPQRVATILHEELEKLRKTTQYGHLILSEFSFLGVEQADGNGASFLGAFRTTPGSKWKVYRAYYSRLAVRMNSEGIKFPAPSNINLLGNMPGAPALDIRIREAAPPTPAPAPAPAPADAHPQA